jgi:hypothetical protein
MGTGVFYRFFVKRKQTKIKKVGFRSNTPVPIDIRFPYKVLFAKYANLPISEIIPYWTCADYLILADLL